MTAEELRTHIKYSGWASRKLMDAATALSEDQRTRQTGVSHNSLIGTLNHIFFADRVWFARVVDPSAIPGGWTDFPTGQTLSIAWPEIQKRWEDWATGLNDSDVLNEIEYKDNKGSQHTTPLCQIVMHVVNHATLHRGQAMAMIRQFGVQPPATDLIFYYRELAAK